MLKVVVCVKQVPEVAELVLDPATRRLRREGLSLLINPFDRRALLEAIRLREEHGAHVTAISMGPPAAVEALREALGLGVDRAVHLCDRRFAGADTLATARALARAIEGVGADLVLAGRYSIDAETGQVGPEVAELLGFAFLGGVRRMAVAAVGGGDPATSAWELRVECETDDGACEIAAPLPAVVTCTDRWKTRAPIVMPDDDRAASAPVETWTVETLGGDAADYGEAGSPTWVADVQQVETERRRARVDGRESLAAAVAATLALFDEVRSSAGESDRARGLAHAPRDDPRDGVWVVAERALDGAFRPVSFELLGAADEIARALGVGVAALAVDPLPSALLPAGRAAPGDAAELLRATQELGRAGADVLIAPGGGIAATPESFTDALVAAVREHAPRSVLAPATALCRDLVPRVAARLGLGLTGDAIGLELDAEGRLRQLKPAFGGQVVAPILSRTRPEIATVRPGMLAPVRPDPARPPARVVRTALAQDGGAGLRWLGFADEVSHEGAALEAARAVVCVGFGLGGRERIAEVERLAHLLGGAVGATRRVCDAGHLPRQLQIGISGRSVAPAFYLALGVRGSFNHLVGMQRAGRVVAVNRDPDAEVFAAADLGITADAPSFLAALIAALEERAAQAPVR